MIFHVLLELKLKILVLWHSIKAGLDPGLDSGPWTLNSGLQITIEKETRKKNQ